MAIPPVRPISERKVAAHFLEAGAVSMADAIPFAPARPSRVRAFERLKGADVLRTDGQGKWWLDEARWNGRRSDRRTRVVFAMLAVGVAAAVAALR
ncbi:hypothetical protein [Erythrobacter sp. BLCC-B19]|uniref:hypothetical protein n=1 Tax=Erythrobacter sp. BLCC-B19 TaxID=3025315 RepID=UPI002362FF78|nr:hypothetical protein [Erythrobacter sp. BLCC-B19]WDA40583.1 hypothetical protein PS060_13570 [Erythrobacter sp. BLCC-B19]